VQLWSDTRLRRLQVGFLYWRQRLLVQLDERLAGSGRTASQMVCGTAGPGQGQLREFYLTAVEAVDPGLREKYAKIYRNY
jgi:hypothetical protein